MTQWCHGSLRFRYGWQGNWVRRNVGNISVLNHEGEPMDITQALAPGFAHVQTKLEMYAGECLNLSHFTISRK